MTARHYLLHIKRKYVIFIEKYVPVMQTLTVQITNTNGLKALHDLEDRHFIRIVDDAGLDSPSLPGGSLSLKAFKNWVAQAEQERTITLQEAKSKWAAQRKKLQKNTR
jgi:hypothetical protein